MPERTISICKELTKVNEFVFRGAPSNVKNKILEDKENIKGEFVAVIDRQTSKNQDFDNKNKLMVTFFIFFKTN